MPGICFNHIVIFRVETIKHLCTAKKTVVQCCVCVARWYPESIKVKDIYFWFFTLSKNFNPNHQKDFNKCLLLILSMFMMTWLCLFPQQSCINLPYFFMGISNSSGWYNSCVCVVLETDPLTSRVGLDFREITKVSAYSKFISH